MTEPTITIRRHGPPVTLTDARDAVADAASTLTDHVHRLPADEVTPTLQRALTAVVEAARLLEVDA